MQSSARSGRSILSAGANTTIPRHKRLPSRTLNTSQLPTQALVSIFTHVPNWEVVVGGERKVGGYL